MKYSDFIKDKNNLRILQKRLRRFYRNETAYSITLNKWDKLDRKSMLEYSNLPGVINKVVNIAITLERYFSFALPNAIETAKAIHKLHGNEIDVYMKGWFNYGNYDQRVKYLNPEKALKEQIARGFVPLGSVTLNPDLPYIRSNVKPYIYPKQWANKPYINLGGIYDKLTDIGVSGYTGIVLPKKINGR